MTYDSGVLKGRMGVQTHHFLEHGSQGFSRNIVELIGWWYAECFVLVSDVNDIDGAEQKKHLF